MIRIILIYIYSVAVIKIACLPVGQSWADDTIVYQDEVPWDGKKYSFGFQTLFGVSRRERAQEKKNISGAKYLDVEGEYSYPTPDGSIKTVFYRSNDEGYHASEPILQYPKTRRVTYAENSRNVNTKEIPNPSESIVNKYILNTPNNYHVKPSLKNQIDTPKIITKIPNEENFNGNFSISELPFNAENYTFKDVFKALIEENTIFPTVQEVSLGSNNSVIERILYPDRIIFPDNMDDNIITKSDHIVPASVFVTTEVPFTTTDSSYTTINYGEYEYDEFGLRMGVPPAVVASLLGR